MPRDNSGNVSLPAGNPVVSNTDITSAWGNTTMADIATMLQDSLSRSGKGGMLVPFQNQSGTSASPGVTFLNFTNTGMYRTATELGFSFLGNIKAIFAAALATFKTAVKMDSTLEVTGRITATAGVDGILASDLPAPNYALSSLSTGTFNTSNLAWTDVTNAIVVDFVATGRPVEIYVVDDGSGSEFDLSASNSGAALSGVKFQLLRGATPVGTTYLAAPKNDGAANGTAQYPPGTMFALDVPAAGTYTYKLQTKANAATDKCYVRYAKLYVKEI